LYEENINSEEEEQNFYFSDRNPLTLSRRCKNHSRPAQSDLSQPQGTVHPGSLLPRGRQQRGAQLKINETR
jgi:hypothetical protein